MDALMELFGYRRWSVEFVIPIKTISVTNAREFWRVRAKRAKAERVSARDAFFANASWARVQTGEFEGALRITLTRLATHKLDSDNLAGACKSVRDGIADALGMDDGDELLTWEYAQEKAKEYGVRVKIEAL